MAHRSGRALILVHLVPSLRASYWPHSSLETSKKPTICAQDGAQVGRALLHGSKQRVSTPSRPSHGCVAFSACFHGPHFGYKAELHCGAMIQCNDNQLRIGPFPTMHWVHWPLRPVQFSSRSSWRPLLLLRSIELVQPHGKHQPPRDVMRLALLYRGLSLNTGVHKKGDSVL